MAENVLLDQQCAERIMAAYYAIGTWRALAQLTGVNYSLLWQVAHGKCRSDKVRVAFGLAPLGKVEIVPCVNCGDVHKRLKTCDGKRKSKHRVRWSPDCTPELRDAIRAECEREGMTSAQFLLAMWNAYNEFWKFLDFLE